MACNCIETKNAELEVTHKAMINAWRMDRVERCIIDVFHPDDVYDESGLPNIAADFCPFCGTRYIPVDAPGDTTTKEDQ